MRQTPNAGMAATGEIVRATGLCVICDFKFINEVVARYPDRAMPGGWAYIELRHLGPAALSALGGAQTPGPS